MRVIDLQKTDAAARSGRSVHSTVVHGSQVLLGRAINRQQLRRSMFSVVVVVVLRELIARPLLNLADLLLVLIGVPPRPREGCAWRLAHAWAP